MSLGLFEAGLFEAGLWFEGSQPKPPTPPIPPVIQAGGIVKYRYYEQEENDRLALAHYQRKRREAMIEDEEILAVVIAIANRIMH